jgi:hypothetical protein
MKGVILLLPFLLIVSLLKAQVFTSSNLPIVIISTNNVSIPDEPKIPGTMKIIDNGPGQINHITDLGNVYDGNIGIEIRGSYSASLPQKPYAVETRDITQNDSAVSLFGFPEESDWVLLANYNDKVFMRNALAFKLFNEMGQYASRTRFCEVTVNGVYQGIYVFGEKIKRDDGRVDIDKLDPDENSGEPLTGGYIFKIDYWDNQNSWKSPYHPIGHPNFDVHFVYYTPKPEEITMQQRSYIKDYVTTFESALYSPFGNYEGFIDKQSFIDYFLVNELARNNDGFKKSFYFYKDRDGIDKRINCGPVWDFDWAWKNIDECAIFANTDGSGWAYKVNDCYPDVNSPGWHIRLLQDTAFRNELNCRWKLFRNDILNTDSLLNWVDYNASYLWQAQQRHYTRWPILGLNVGTPVVGTIPTTFQGEINGFKNWILLRLNWLDANMPGNCYNILNTDYTQSKPAVTAFPNPASDHLFIELPVQDNMAKLQVFSMSGKLMNIPFNFDNNLFELDLHTLQTGVYYARITGGNKEINTIKLLIAR